MNRRFRRWYAKDPTTRQINFASVARTFQVGPEMMAQQYSAGFRHSEPVLRTRDEDRGPSGSIAPKAATSGALHTQSRFHIRSTPDADEEAA